MDVASLQRLYDYHCWATRRVLDAAERCTPEQLTATGPAPHGSLLATLVHSLAAERVWLQRARDGGKLTDLADLEGITTVAALNDAWDAQQVAMREYLAGITDEQLAEKFRYVVSRGAWRDEVLWQALIYIVLHGIQHRSEAAILLTAYGESPGNLDFIIFVQEQGNR